MSTTTAYRSPGYDGPEGTECHPRRARKHSYCPVDEPHLPHGMNSFGYIGQTCGGIPTPVEPRDCLNCHGTGLVEEYVGTVLREVKCTGEGDIGDCDGGIKVWL